MKCEKIMRKIFSFKWENGSINDNIVRFAKNRDISFRYDHFCNIELFVNGLYYSVKSEINNDTVDVYIEL